MLTSATQVRPHGCLLSGICNISKVLYAFLKGHIEAMLTIGSHHCEFAVFHFFTKVDFCNTSNEILMIFENHMSKQGELK